MPTAYSCKKKHDNLKICADSAWCYLPLSGPVGPLSGQLGVSHNDSLLMNFNLVGPNHTDCSFIRAWKPLQSTMPRRQKHCSPCQASKSSATDSRNWSISVPWTSAAGASDHGDSRCWQTPEEWRPKGWTSEEWSQGRMAAKTPRASTSIVSPTKIESDKSV